MDRTIKVQLKPTPVQAHSLSKTLEQHTACFNAVAAEGFTSACSNGVELHKRTYYPLRAQYPDLPAQLVCAARVKATEAVKSALTWKQKHEASYPKNVEKAKKKGSLIPLFQPVTCPHSEIACIRYDVRSYWVKWESFTCSLATVDGRVELPFAVPAHLLHYVGHKVCSADLCYRKGRFTLHIVVSIPQPDVAPTPEVVGVDLGLNRPAVTSTHQFLGERRWKAQERRMFRLKRKLQAKGTKSAKRHLRRLSGKQFRRRRDHDHVLSKRMVARTPDGATIALENLKDIRETSKIGRGKNNKTVETKRRLHCWSFAQLYSFVAYKAEARGIVVVKIDPAIPVRPALVVATNIGPIVARNRCFTAAPVATNSMQTITLQKTFGTSIWLVLPARVYLHWRVALSSNLSFQTFGSRNKPPPLQAWGT